MKLVLGGEREKKNWHKRKRRDNSLVFLSLFLIFSSTLVSLPDKMALDASLKTNASYKDVNDGLSRNFYPTLGCANKDQRES